MEDIPGTQNPALTREVVLQSIRAKHPGLAGEVVIQSVTAGKGSNPGT